MTEYATEGEELTTTLLERLASLDEALVAQEPTGEAARVYWEERLAARVAFLEGIGKLDPPEELRDLHETALDLFDRLVEAEEALAARVGTLQTPVSPAAWWATPEGQTAREVDQEAIAICHAAQAGFDATQKREVLADVPWIPSDMRQSVRVAFGCPE